MKFDVQQRRKMMSEKPLSDWLRDFDSTDHTALIVATDRIVVPGIARLEKEKNELVAAVAGMRDKWTSPSEMAKLQSDIEALRGRLCGGCEATADTLLTPKGG